MPRILVIVTNPFEGGTSGRASAAAIVPITANAGFAAPQAGSVPALVNFQGILTDSGGGPISDGPGDARDPCPTISTFGLWEVLAGDDDCDGFSSADEGLIGTDSTDACADTLTPNDETDDKWPPDFDDNRVINTIDVFQVLPPILWASVPPTSPRVDLFPDGVINTTDVFRVLPPFLGSSCVP